jgi:hypothetical protein
MGMLSCTVVPSSKELFIDATPSAKTFVEGFQWAVA